MCVRFLLVPVVGHCPSLMQILRFWKAGLGGDRVYSMIMNAKGFPQKGGTKENDDDKGIMSGLKYYTVRCKNLLKLVGAFWRFVEFRGGFHVQSTP